MSIKETFLGVIEEIDAAHEKRELELKNRELEQVKAEERFKTSIQSFGKKEAGLVEWEATLRDREEALNVNTKKARIDKEMFEKRQEDFKAFLKTEQSKLDALATKLATEKKSLEIQKEEFERDKKQQTLIKSKLVEERAALDSAWNEAKYKALTTQ